MGHLRYNFGGLCNHQEDRDEVGIGWAVASPSHEHGGSLLKAEVFPNNTKAKRGSYSRTQPNKGREKRGVFLYVIDMSFFFHTDVGICHAHDCITTLRED